MRQCYVFKKRMAVIVDIFRAIIRVNYLVYLKSDFSFIS